MGRHANPINQVFEHRVKYARLTDKDEWEYGHIQCVDVTKTYVKQGVAATLEEASAANDISFGEWVEDPSTFQPQRTYKVTTICSGNS